MASQSKEQKKEKYMASAAYEEIIEIKATKLRRLKIKKLMRKHNLDKGQATKLWNDRQQTEAAIKYKNEVAKADDS